ncbi:helix-turn-helix domain-containing protein [Actinoplanes sp. CA-054009]
MNRQRITGTQLQNNVVRNLGILRRARGWSLVNFVEKLAVQGWQTDRNQYGRLESGKRSITVDELAILASVFGIDPWELTKAPNCNRCMGAPPSGFSCNACGAIGGTT